MTRAAAFSLALLCLAPAVRTDEAKVDAFIRAETAKKGIPGLSVAVVREGKVLFARGYGEANVEHRAPATPATVYQLASVTKTFTAVATLMLVQEGRIALADPISKHLPDLPGTWSPVTVRHLLNHTSGIPSYTNSPTFHAEPRRDYTPQALLARVRDLPLEFQPGERFAYNNTGYYLLGLLIEKVAGKSYGEFLAERIFRPLEMTSTRVNDHAAVIPNRAQGYQRQGATLKHGEYVSPTQPFAAGALVSTVEDLARWDAALDTDRLLRSDLRQEMWTATALPGGGKAGYGYGWSVGEAGGHRMIEHGGGIRGFSTQFTRFPDDRLTVIVLTNLEGGHAGPLARGIAALYVPELAPRVAQAIPDADPKTTERLRKLLIALAAGMADPAEFAPDFRAVLFPTRVREAQTLLTSLGPLKTMELLEARAEDGALHRRYRVTFGGTALLATFTVAKDGLITGAGLRPE
jgi:D-alanyl-D-alanine carboxypeptidase